MTKPIYRVGDTFKRADTGARVRVTDVRLTGHHVFYVTEDLRDGHTAIIADRDTRPDTGKS